MKSFQLLPKGSNTLAIYADASYTEHAGVGAWAFSVPGFGLLKSEVETACSNTRVELAAVIHALKVVIALDHTDRPLRVWTDCQFTIRVLEFVARRETMPARKGYSQVMDLYEQACDLTAHRVVKAVQRQPGDPFHAECDRVARETLRRYCTDGSVARIVLLGRARARLQTIESEMRQVEKHLRKLQNTLLQIEMQVAALSAAGRSSEPQCSSSASLADTSVV